MSLVSEFVQTHWLLDGSGGGGGSGSGMIHVILCLL